MKLKGASIPETIVRRVKERRGTEHSFADLDPTRTALVVIDLQHAFMNEAVGFAAVPAARDIVSAVNRLAAAVRETGGGVFWIKMTHDKRCFADWSVAYALLVMGHLDPEHAAAGLAQCRRQPVDRGDNVASRRHRCKSDRLVHEGVLQIDDGERRPRGI